MLIHLTRVSCHLSKLSHLIKFSSLLNQSAVWNLSYPLCHSFNSSEGSVLLISSSIIPSSQVQVLFLPCSSGVLPGFFLSHLVSTGVVSIPSCPLYSSFIALQPPRFTWCSLFSNLYRSALNCVQLCYVLSFNFSTSQSFFGFTHLSKKQLSFTSSLPLPFLSGAILDLETRSSCSGGVL